MKLVNKYLNQIILMMAVFALALVAVSPATVGAQIDDDTKKAACSGISAAGTDCGTGQASGGINNLIADIVNILSWVVGVVAVIMLMVGGFRYVISAGDANSVSAAKNTILYAVVGLVIAALAQFIVQFVLNRTTD